MSSPPASPQWRPPASDADGSHRYRTLQGGPLFGGARLAAFWGSVETVEWSATLAMSLEPITELSPTRYFWLRLAALAAGFCLLGLAHGFTQRSGGSDGRQAMIGVILLVAVSLTMVGRSVHVIVTTGFSDAHRVFRSRHLLFCATLLLLAGTGAAYAVVTHDPFGRLFAHGQITGEDVVDVGVVVAALVCMVGAGVALTGSWDASRAERNWHSWR